MLHNLKTLYEHTARHYPGLCVQFFNLKEYCEDSVRIEHEIDLNMGYNSLKWFIYTLRTEIKQAKLEDAFYFVLAECQNREDDLYNNIKKTKTFFKYQSIITFKWNR